MGNELAVKKKNNAVQALAARLQIDPDAMEKTLKATAFRDCKTNEEFLTMVIVANTYQLNPLLKEIYAFSKGGIVTPVIPVDGWVSLVNRQKNHNGVELLENEVDGKLKSVTAKFYSKDKEYPTVVTEYLEECMKSTETWTKWPRRMLRHKAYIQGARIAYGFSGVYDPDEAERIIEAQIVNEHNMKPTTEAPRSIEEPKDQEPTKPTESTSSICGKVANVVQHKYNGKVKTDYTILNSDGEKVIVGVWKEPNKDIIAETSVVLEDIKVGEYQGKPQYTAKSIRIVEDETVEPEIPFGK
jgi:hypothetical protein